MTEHIIGRSRLFDPPRIELRQRFDLSNGFADVPALVGVHHQAIVRPDLFAHEGRAADVVFVLFGVALAVLGAVAILAVTR